MKVTFGKYKKGAYEAYVVMAIKQCETYSGSLEGFVDNFNDLLKSCPKKTYGRIEAFYKVERLDDRVEIWHLNSQNEKDRLIATVTL